MFWVFKKSIRAGERANHLSALTARSTVCRGETNGIAFAAGTSAVSKSVPKRSPSLHASLLWCAADQQKLQLPAGGGYYWITPQSNWSTHRSTQHRATKRHMPRKNSYPLTYIRSGKPLEWICRSENITIRSLLPHGKTIRSCALNYRGPETSWGSHP